MSTILKALKRIDQTTPSSEDIQSWPPIIDTKETVKNRAKKNRRRRRLFLSFISILIIVAAAWLVFSQKHLFSAKQSADKASASESDPSTPSASSENSPVYHAKIYPPSRETKVATPKRASTPNNQNYRSGLKNKSKKTMTAKLPRKMPKIPEQQKTLRKPIFTASGQRKPAGRTPPVRSRINRPQRAGSPKTVRIPNRSSMASQPKETKSQPQQRSYRRLDESKLKLQAIAWSNKAAQRLAVINGHVVREGESVEGFSINQIRQDDVVVNDGTESWRLEFRLK